MFFQIASSTNPNGITLELHHGENKSIGKCKAGNGYAHAYAKEPREENNSEGCTESDGIACHEITEVKRVLDSHDWLLRTYTLPSVEQVCTMPPGGLIFDESKSQECNYQSNQTHDIFCVL